ncbi:hypothetical protein [Carnobacterium maltaromaticum]|uniref:hypothetical protein n=1 Tax=Carnobacterium maltaromaticum TaxID=2751 RepID=UPI00191BAB5E|nr:hypothetical protein [Carnobacterium maltaromaticum]CAD5898191.1 hypothetical protein CMALT394_200073 [Carnobacterium maltaromaticum]
MTFEIILSIIAIAVSVFTFYRQKKEENLINKINLKSIFFEKIFFMILTEEIIEAQEKVNLFDNKLAGTDEMEKILSKIGKKSRYFYYTDKNFHTELKKQLLKIDELCTSTENLDRISYNEVSTNLDNELENLYSIMLTKYTNG